MICDVWPPFVPVEDEVQASGAMENTRTMIRLPYLSEDEGSLNTHSQHSSDEPLRNVTNRRYSLAAALSRGEHQIVREILRRHGKSTRKADKRFVSYLTSLVRGSLGPSDVRKLRKGLLYISKDWILTEESFKITRDLTALVVVLECLQVSLRRDVLCIVRSKVDYLIDQLNSDFLHGTRLATFIQFILRSLRDPNRREGARGRFERFVIYFRRKIKSTLSKWHVEFDD